MNEIQKIVKEECRKAEMKWTSLYLGSVNGEFIPVSYNDRDRLYAKMLAARETARIANNEEGILVAMEDRATLALMDWLDWPTPQREGRQEGLRQILDAVEARVDG